MSYSLSNLSNERRIVILTGQDNLEDPYNVNVLPCLFSDKHSHEEIHSIKITFKEVEGTNELFVKQLKQRT